MSTIRRVFARLGAATVAALMVLALAVAPAAAATSSISPSSQSRSYGQLVTWTASYQNNPGLAGEARFYYGDGTFSSYPTSGSTGYVSNPSKRFYPCTGRSYSQRLDTLQAGQLTSRATASTFVSGGPAC